MNRKRHAMVFMRYPERGKVKSRLARHLGDEITYTLYRYFIEDLLDTLQEGDHIFHIVFYPKEKEEEMIRLFGSNLSYIPQTGRDLGERMKNAFIHCFSDASRETALLFGSDIPDLSNTIIEEAFRSLQTHDAVLGPSLDGGYYLIGFRRTTFYPEVFDNIAWGTRTVFKETITILKKARHSTYILPEWRDIDKPEDLHKLITESRKTGFSKSKTMTYLEQIGLMR